MKESPRKLGIGIRIAITVVAAIAASAAVSGIAIADSPNTQYANISPLPGGGVAISPDGRPDGQGAFQINVPVAYTPRWGYIGTGVFEGNHMGTSDYDNGSGLLGVGFGESTRVFISGMQVSEIWDESKALNAQVQLWKEKEGTLAVSAGYQDILRKEDGQRAPYIVASKELAIKGKPVYGTFGFGGGRFLNHPFTGLSVPLSDQFNTAVEYDGWQVNFGIGWRPGGRSGKVTFVAAENGGIGPLFGVNVVTWFGR